jgi:hypothetical protein
MVMRYRETDEHAFKWDGDKRFICLFRKNGTQTPWMADGEGPIQVECPDCGGMNEIGPETLEHAHA